MKNIKRLIKRFVPQFLLNLRNRIRNRDVNKEYMEIFRDYDRALEKLKNKPKLTVAFLLIESAIWKYDELYRLIQNDTRFEPVILILPYTNNTHKELVETYENTLKFVKQKQYKYQVAFDPENGSWVDVTNSIVPDIVFYTYNVNVLPTFKYCKKYFPSSLSCYVPYSSMICSTPDQFNKPIQNYVWRFFVENNLVFDLIKLKSDTKGVNAVVTGFPALDSFFNKNYRVNEDIWKDENKIRIIWAPHYTIKPDTSKTISFSSFLKYSDFMIEMAIKYKDQIQIAFKPHPALRQTLNNEWGEEKTDIYYSKWENMVNTFVQSGEYIDLFYTSDAMIFDSVSFISEYLYTKKPSLFMYKKDINKQLNVFGIEALSCHSRAYDFKDVEDFILSLILGQKDKMYNKKEAFFLKYLKPDNGETASYNIFNYLRTIFFNSPQ